MSDLPQVVPGNGEGAAQHDLVGGKGANLAKLASAGPTVPRWFTITTEAYSAFMADSGLQQKVADLLAGVDVADTTELDRVTAEIREAILSVPLPEGLAEEIRAAYAQLEGEPRGVAVRSSGTAEDLEGSSFAGLHDTFLGISGADQVLDAVRRCWASMWTARATAYRQSRDFDQAQARIAVVVQEMVESEVAGVMFTANPISGAVDETVINANWGLGESVVSGLITPDEYVLERGTLKVRRRNLGDKTLEFVSAEDGSGAVQRPIEGIRREEPCLSDDQAAALGQVGREITAFYGGFPQDIEWAMVGGEVYVLQARPVTGVEFSWDEDLEYFHIGGEEDEREDFVYTRAWSDDFSMAAITPLFYTTRTKEISDAYFAAQKLYGHDKVAGIRSWKYYKGEGYYSSNMEAAWIPKMMPKHLRSPATMTKVPPTWWADLEAAPFSWLEYGKTNLRVMLLEGRTDPFRYAKSFKEHFAEREQAKGPSEEELRRADDATLIGLTEAAIENFRRINADQFNAFMLYAPLMLGSLGDLLGRWYDGDVAAAFGELLSGLDQQTITLTENHELWQFGERIRSSELLTRVLEEHEGATFFEELKNHEEGREFLADYEPWRELRGHRGAADREFMLPRRADDPAIDYHSFKALLAGSGEDPIASEETRRQARREREDDVHRSISRGALGFLKLETFKVVHAWCLTFMAHRDNEREFLDLLSYTERRCFVEIGRRLAERALIEEELDAFFLGLQENYSLLEGRLNAELCRAKIAGRKRNYLRRKNGEADLPAYVGVDGAPALPGEMIGTLSSGDTSEAEGGSLLRGGGTSGGTVTGRARVLHDVSEISTLERGDVLVCNSTDPGWTPVFMVIGGLVMATGGVLAHGSCLSREYGLPAVVVPNAMRRIEDGAEITVDGNAGTVLVAEGE